MDHKLLRRQWILLSLSLNFLHLSVSTFATSREYSPHLSWRHQPVDEEIVVLCDQFSYLWRQITVNNAISLPSVGPRAEYSRDIRMKVVSIGYWIKWKCSCTKASSIQSGWWWRWAMCRKIKIDDRPTEWRGGEEKRRQRDRIDLKCLCLMTQRLEVKINGHIRASSDQRYVRKTRTRSRNETKERWIRVDAFGTAPEIKNLNLFHLGWQTYNFIRFGRNGTWKGHGGELEDWCVWVGELH